MKPSVLFRSLATALFIALSVPTFAQEKSSPVKASSFGVNDQTLAIGFGLGIRYGYADNSSIAPAIAFIYDVGVADNVGPGTIGIGGIAGYKTASYERMDWMSGNEFSARWSNFILGARGSYHFALADGFENLDLYGGLMMGLRFERFRNRTTFNSGGAIAITENFRRETRSVVGFFGGGRYNFTPQVGAWVEVGYDISLIKAGIHVNL